MLSSKKIGLLVFGGIVSFCLVLVVILLCVTEFSHFPKIVYNDFSEVEAGLHSHIEEINAILKPYGLQTEDPIVEEEGNDFDITFEIVISNQETLIVDCFGRYGQYPQFLVTLIKNSKEFFEFNLEEYPYVCQIAAFFSDQYFSNNEFSKEKYMSYCNIAVEEAYRYAYENDGEPDGYYWGDIGFYEMKSVFWHKGNISFDIDKCHDSGEIDGVEEAFFESYLHISIFFY